MSSQVQLRNLPLYGFSNQVPLSPRAHQGFLFSVWSCGSQYAPLMLHFHIYFNHWLFFFNVTLKIFKPNQKLPCWQNVLLCNIQVSLLIINILPLFFFLLFMCMCMHVCGMYVCYVYMHVNIRGQLVGVISLFTLCGFQRLNSSCLAPSTLNHVAQITSHFLTMLLSESLEELSDTYPFLFLVNLTQMLLCLS